MVVKSVEEFTYIERLIATIFRPLLLVLLLLCSRCMKWREVAFSIYSERSGARFGSTCGVFLEIRLKLRAEVASFGGPNYYNTAGLLYYIRGSHAPL